MRRTCGVGGEQLILHVDHVRNLWTLNVGIRENMRNSTLDS
jgi:hypothetical protein